MRQLTHGALFAGIGGFDLGFAWAGIKTLWDVEIDEWCQGQLKKNFPDTEIFGDIRDCGKENLKPVDIISGGFPCQPFSSAGKRRGAEDDRYLWPEMLRVIGEMRPAWVVGENVSGLGSMGFPISDIKVASRHITRYTDHDYYEGVLTQEERMYVDFICENFEGIDYDVQPFIIPSVGLGAKHLRRRIWLVAHSGSARLQDGGRAPLGEQGTIEEFERRRMLKIQKPTIGQARHIWRPWKKGMRRLQRVTG